ncbi:MAG: hypothetical protein D3925_01835, partial [Candidatus Electrothrix sp. AR5]|nr:hypothetical protein [Candidatus Electrothrix sp. AR5]
FFKHYLEVDLEIEHTGGTKLDYRKKIASGWAKDAHMVMTEVCASYPDPAAIMNDFVSNSSFSLITSENQSPVDLIREAGTLGDPYQREKKYQEADRILTHEEAVIMPLYHERPFFLVNQRVKGWKYASMGGQQLQDCSMKNE